MKRRLTYTGVGAVLFLAFFVFSYLVSRDIFTQVDFDTTVKLQDKIPRRMDEPFSMLSIVGSFEVTTAILLLFLIGVVFATKKWYRILLLAFFILFHIVEVLGKTAIEHHGPPFMFLRYTYDLHFPSGYISTDYFSYPSGHVGRTMFLVGFISLIILTQKWLLSKKIISWGMLAGFALIMIVSRIYLGEHWLSDTIGGSMLGLSFAFFTMVFW